MDFLDAAKHGHVQVVRHLLKCGIDKDENMISEEISSASGTIRMRHTQTNTALWHACGEGHLEVVRILLEERADTSLRGPGGTALMAAISHDQVEVVKLLLAAGVRMDVRDSSAVRDRSWVLDLLMEAGGSVDVPWTS